MEILLAAPEHARDLARLLWLHADPQQQDRQSVESFEVDLRPWLSSHGHSHHAFIARSSEAEIVGMAWLALLPRVPRPGTISRHSADIQSVFVLPDQRGKGLGAALITAATNHARELGANRVTVQSGRKATPLYERLGYASSRQLQTELD